MFNLCKSALKVINVRAFNILKVLPKLHAAATHFCLTPPRLFCQQGDVTADAEPFTMKLETPIFNSLFTDEVKELQRLFESHSYELRIAGGAVRDLLMGQEPKDLDFATVATPTQMKEMFTQHNVRMINTNGERHGTITARINDKENFEVTTLRIDVVTDGRHAEVQFTTNWRLDSERRDLTINSMFLGLDGTVYDYFNGHEDLQNRRVVFVGNPYTRIQEDYLRILRYFRFYGRIATSPNDHDTKTMEALRELGSGLSKISGERIWAELSKIVGGNYAGELIEAMVSLGLGAHMGLPDLQPDVLDQFRKVCRTLRTNQRPFHHMTLMCGLMRNEEDLLRFHLRMKMSAFERDLAIFLINNREDMPHVQPLRPYQRLVVHTKGKVPDTVYYVKETLKYRGDLELHDQFDSWTVPRCPVSGNHLRERGVTAGKHMGSILKDLKDIWIDSDFQMTADQLLDHVPELLERLGPIQKNVKIKDKSEK